MRTDTNEDQIVALAIELDQNKDPDSKARARALRGVGLPVHRYVCDEITRWKDPGDAADSLVNFGKAVAAGYAHLIVAMTTEGAPREVLRGKVVEVLEREIRRHLLHAAEEGL